MSEDEKPKLGMRAPLGIKRTVETGQVKQSFSHGRSNTVVVEVKRRRILGKPGEVEVVQPEVEVVAPAPTVAPPPPRPPVAPPAPSNLSRQELQTKLLREAEEARLNSLENARKREEQSRQQSSVDEKRRAEANREAEEMAAEAARIAAEDAVK
jgi:translation initiation factor IF-2